MEEDETNETGHESRGIRSISVVDLAVADYVIGTPQRESVCSVGAEAGYNDGTVSLESAAVDDDHFEQVSLKDHNDDKDIFGGAHIMSSISSRSAERASAAGSADSSGNFSRHSEGRLYGSPDLDSMDDYTSSNIGSESQYGCTTNQSVISGAVDSEFSEFGISSFGSPHKSKQKFTMPNVSPELLHLVDSAIMGKPDSLDKLKNIVSGVGSFGSVEEEDGMAYLVVDSLLATMGGVESFEDEDSNPPSVMLNSRAAIVSAELLPSLPWIGDSKFHMSPRTRMVRGLLAILRACTRNRAMCSMAGLLGVLLRSAEIIFLSNVDSSDEQKGWDGTPLCYCIQQLGAHSLNVVDLHRWLEIITNTVTSAWSSSLMSALERAMTGKESMGPACTFEFDGESSGLLGPGESRWPFMNGYAFATWIYIESFADTLNTATAAAAIAAAAAAKSGKSSAMSAAAAASALAGEGTAHMPRLFSFLSADNQGIEAYFHAQFLVVESGSGKGKKASLHFTHAFKPQCWYFICLEHVSKHGLIGRTESELRLYVDGTLFESRSFEFPRITKPLSFCCIGTNPPPTIAGLQRRRRQCPLFAEMGPVYIFKEPVGPDRISRLASRGGDALPSFGHGAGVPWFTKNSYLLSKAEGSALLDTEIGGSLHLLYHPNLLNGHYCPDASPSSASGLTRRPAEVLGQVHVAMRMRPVEALWALAYGGPMSLLPLLVSSVKKDTLELDQGNAHLFLATASFAASIFRIMSIAILHPGNNEELCHAQGPYVLSKILNYLLQRLSSLETDKRNGVGNEELVAAVVSLCQSQKLNHELKVQLFCTLLLDLKIWSLCSYGLQKKLLSSLADMVFSESMAMRDSNAIQLLLDGCRKCYWTIPEKDSVNIFPFEEVVRPVGECNALVDELLVIIELLMGSASPSLAADDIRCLLGFIVDCPQPNQVSRVLHLIYRLIVQPNTSRAHMFAHTFIGCGGVETLLVLLQREAKTGDHNTILVSQNNDENLPQHETQKAEHVPEDLEKEATKTPRGNNLTLQEKESNFVQFDSHGSPTDQKLGRRSSVSESTLKNLGGISLSISAYSARNNVYNVDTSDGIVVAIVGVIGALVSSGHLTFDSHAPSSDNLVGGMLPEGGRTMFDDKVSLLLFALQNALQAASNRLLTTNIYTALFAASINASIEDGLNFYDCGHRFEHLQLLMVLLRSLPYASMDLQSRALQDLLVLACSHPLNRNSLTKMEEWPEWILEILISNYENGERKNPSSISVGDIEDLVHNFLIIMLEYSMREKDGWKDIEATIHCAEWLCIVGGSSTGEQRVRREASLPVFKRRLLGGLLDFATSELQLQTQVIAAVAAGVAAVGLSPQDSKAETEVAAQLSVALVENSIVLLMLLEDHLRLQSKNSYASRSVDTSPVPLSIVFPLKTMTGSDSFEVGSIYKSTDSGRLPLDVLTAMADENGQVSVAVMERLAAAAAAEPYESVSCAFVSYGSYCMDLAEGWKFRSRLWFGVGVPSKPSDFGGGGSGWDSWKLSLEKDSQGNWIELPLVKKSVAMLQALLLDEAGLGGGLGIGGGSGTGMGGMTALYQLLDSDQPFLCMLRMVLLSLREEDNGETSVLMRHVGVGDIAAEGAPRQSGNILLEGSTRISFRQPRSALLWSVLSPVLNMPISDSKRQRVLVACCALYSEVWHSVSKDKKVLRKQYLESILPPFVAVLRRWRPVLSGIHELPTADGLNPLVADDRALAADALPLEAALSMISPDWAAAFSSPPAAMALAMIAAGAGGGETVVPVPTVPLKRDSSLLERKTATLQTFSSFQKPLDLPTKGPAHGKDKAAAKAAALAAARDLQRNAKIGSGRGLSAIAMATSSQRRSASDMERVRRWSTTEAMSVAWMECLQSVDTKSVYGKDFNALSYKFIAVLVASFALARNMQRSEVDRRSQVDMLMQHQFSRGTRAWCKLIHRLIELKCLFGPLRNVLYESDQVFWKLDHTETGSRMRRYLRRFYGGSNHFGSAANYDDQVDNKYDQREVPVVASEAISYSEITEEDEHAEILLDNEICDTIQYDKHQTIPANSDETQNYSGDSEHGEFANARDFGTTPVATTGFFPSKLDERIIIELSCSMVRTLRVIQGTFQVTTKRINFIVNVGRNKPPGIAACDTSDSEKEYSWPMSSVHQIYSRRYLLRRSALELFMVDRSNFFFDFGSSECRRNAYRAIVQLKPPHLNNIYLATQRPEQLLMRTQLMERWARWEISNFEYLMQLNTLAGRSYNDITQYPVFPWILSDYTSTSLDFSSPSSYRDLSKPIGALNPDRLEKFKERYSSFDDPIIPKFHYGSHYSSAGTVLYYLVRVEPFTTLSIQLQGGKFDHADRMFSDIAATWKGVLEDMSDVKELVPELFYLPEILTNENSVDFGATQLGEKLDCVKLPPWAANPVDFIQKHRMALESEHVSANLHEWIDLIFGYKQRGKEAIAANNVFFYITYEGAVDVDKISDSFQQRATQDQITYYGQTPSQLLTVPHLRKLPLADVLRLQTIFRNPSEVKPYAAPFPERCNLPASAISASSDAIIVVDMNVPAAHIAHHKWQPNTPDGQGTPFHFQHGKPSSNATAGTFKRMFKGSSGSSSEEWQFPQAQAFASPGSRSRVNVAITGDQDIITGGHADNSVKLVTFDGAKTLESAIGHCSPVTCLSLSPDSSYLVTGSGDATLVLWRIHKASSLQTTSTSEPAIGSSMPVSTSSGGGNFIDNTKKRRIEGPMHVLRGHHREITCCCVNSDHGVVVSCSQSSDVLVHSIRKGRLMRRLPGVEAHALCLSADGVILSWNKSKHSLASYTLNGGLIKTTGLPLYCTLSCMEMSADGRTVLIATNSLENDGIYNNWDSGIKRVKNASEQLEQSNNLNIPFPAICFIDLYSLNVLHVLRLGDGQDITAVALNDDQTNLVISTLDKQLIIFSNPALSVKVVDRMLKLGWEGDGLSPLITS